MRHALPFLLLASGACAAVRSTAPDAGEAPATVPAPQLIRFKSQATAPVVQTASTTRAAVAPVRASDSTPVALRSQTALATRVATTKLDGFHIEGENSVRALMRLVSDISGIPIYVQSVAEEAAADEDIVFDLHWDRPVSVSSILDMASELSDDTVAWTLRHGMVFVTTPENARNAPRTTVIDISDLTFGVQSFAGPEIHVMPSGGIASADVELAEPIGIIDEDVLVDLIRQTIVPGTWDDGRNSIRIQNGKLIVTHD